MACTFEKDLLSAYHDGELDARGRAEVEAHVASCGSCARELGDVQSVSKLIRSAGRVRAPAGLVRAPAAAPRSSGPPRILRFPRFALAAAGAALIAVVAAMFAFRASEKRSAAAPLASRTEKAADRSAPEPSPAAAPAPMPELPAEKVGEAHAKPAAELSSTYTLTAASLDTAQDALTYELREVAVQGQSEAWNEWQVTLSEDEARKLVAALQSRDDVIIAAAAPAPAPLRERKDAPAEENFRASEGRQQRTFKPEPAQAPAAPMAKRKAELERDESGAGKEDDLGDREKTDKVQEGAKAGSWVTLKIRFQAAEVEELERLKKGVAPAPKKE